MTYLDRQDALSSGLATVNSAGNAIMRVDDTTNIAPAPQVNRASVRLAHNIRFLDSRVNVVAAG